MRFLLLTALVAAANAGCTRDAGSGGNPGQWTCTQATKFRFVLPIGDCDQEVNTANQVASYFSGDTYTYQSGSCASGKFTFEAVLGTSNISNKLLDFARDFSADDIEALDAPGQGSGGPGTDPTTQDSLCGGEPIYVSSGGNIDAYEEDDKTPQGHLTYTYGGNAIFRGEGTWKIQTDSGVFDSGDEELSEGTFGSSGYNLSCDCEICELQKRIGLLEKEKENLNTQLTQAENDSRQAGLDKQTADNAANALQQSLNECRAEKECEACPEIPECPEVPECPTCPIIPDACPDNWMCDECPVCTPKTVCPEQTNCPSQGCHNDMSSPVKFGADYWFCDELLPSDCDHEVHGQNVSQACRALCGSCEEAVCAEKYHTKVLIEDIGSIYCDQIYPEECEIAEVKATCCRTCE